MTTFTWKSGTSADWSTATDWTPSGGPPNAATSDAVIGGSGAYTVTIAAGESFLVDSLTFSPTAATLSVAGTLTLGGTRAAMAVSSGTVKLAGGTIAGGTLTLGGGTLTTTAAGGTVASAVVLNAGTLAIAAASTLTLSGNDTLTGGGFVKGPGTLATTGTLTVTGNGSLDGGLVWTNAGTVLDGAELNTGYPSGTGKVTITNQAAGSFDLTFDGQAFAPAGGSTLVLNNAGVFSKTAGTGTSNVTVAVANTGTITATSGTLEFDAGGVMSGTMGASGAGALALGGGTFTVSGAAQTVSGAFDLNGGTIAIGASQVLTLSGAVVFNQGEQINGPGTLSTTGSVSMVASSPYLDGNLTWLNSGTVTEGVTSGNEIYIGYPSGGGTITVANLASGAFDLSSDGQAFYVYSAAKLSLSNAGVLAKTGGTGTSNISVAVANTGTITATSGTLELDGGGVLSGTIGATGAGALALGGGGTFSVTGTTQAISGTLDLNGGVVAIGGGDTLTLSGAVALNTTAQIDGPGTLSTTGTLTANGNALYLDGSVTWLNSGTVLQSGYAYAGYPSGTGSVVVSNLAGGTFDLTADGPAFYPYSTSTLTLSNAGVFSKTGGTGTSNVSVAIANTGTITATSGTLELDGGGLLSGTVGATGAGALALGGGTFTLPGNGRTIGGALELNGGTVSLGSGQTLTLSGPVGWAGGDVSGAGTLVTTGTVSITNVAYIDGGLTWTNSGTVLDEYYFNSGAETAGTNTVVNQAGAVFDLTASGTAFYTYTATSFSNAGLLEMTAPSGTANFYAALTNTGTVTATAGTLELDGGGVLGGMMGASGTGALSLGSGTFTLAGATQTLTGAVNLNGGTISLGSGQALTLSGPVGWAGSDVTGPGTLVTTGTVSITSSAFLDGGVTWINSGTVLDGYYSYSGQNVAGTNTVVNQAGAVFDIAAADYAFYNGGQTNFMNAGLLEMTAASGTQTFYAALANTGTVSVLSGDLYLDGGGTLNGIATVAAGAELDLGGSFTVGTGLTNGGTVGIDGTVAFSAATQIVGGAVNLGSGGTLSLAAGETVTLSGAVAWAGGDVTGAGTLVTTGTVSVISSAYLDGGVTWINSGTVLDGSYSYSGQNVAGTVTVVNQSGGVFDVTAGYYEFYDYEQTNFTNAGLLEMTAASGTAIFYAAVTNTGTITATSGTLALNGGGVLGGTIGATGTGALALASGTFTQASATQTITGALSLDGGTVSLGSGQTLTLSGPVGWAGSDLTGAGTLATSGTVSITGVADIDGNATWINSGTVLDGYYSYSGQNVAGTVTVVNQSGGVFDVTAGYYEFYDYEQTTFTNAGLLEMTATSGTATFYAALTNTGTVTASSGTVSLVGGGTLNGTAGGTAHGVLLLGSSMATTGALAITDAGALASNTDFVVGSSATWSVSGTVADSGRVQIGSTSAGAGTLAIAAGGAFDLTSSDATLLGAGTFKITNAGLIAKTAGSGSASITATLANTGTIDAASGTLKLSAAITGTGRLQVEAGSTLELSGAAVPGNNTIDFDGLGATLKLDANFVPTKPLLGFGAGSVIDLAAASGATAIVNGNTLTITPAGGSALNFVGAASLAGLHVATASDGAGGTLVTLYQQAVAAPHAPEPVAFGNVHLGAAVQQAVTIANAATAGLYAENLDANLSASAGGFTATGTVSGLGAGQANSSALSVVLNTATIGAITGAATLTLASDGSGVDGYGTTTLPSQTVNVTGAVYEYAAPLLSTGTIALGAARVGGAALAGSVVVADGTLATAYQESLIYQFGTALPASLVLSNAGGTVASGQTVAVGVTLNTSAAGNFSGVAVGAGASGVSFVSTGVGTDGLANTTLAAPTLTVSGQVFAAATATLSGTTVAFGNVHVGAVVNAATLTLTNTASGALTDTLTGGTASETGSYSGTVTPATGGGLAAGASGSVTFALNTSAAGAQSGTVNLGFESHDGVLSDLGIAAAPVTVTAGVYAYAAPLLSAGTISLGAARVGGAALAGSVILADGLAASAYQESLIYQFGTALPSGLSVGNAGGTIVAGGTVAVGVTLNTAASGNFTGTAIGAGASGVSFISTGAGTSGLANTTLAAPTLTVSGEVFATATATLSGTVVNFGIVHVGQVVNGATLTLTNTATGALTDSLTGGSATDSGSYTGTVTSNLGGGLGSGASGSVTFGLNTGSAGVQSGSVSLGYDSHDGVLNDLGVGGGTVTVVGTVDNYATAALAALSGQTISGSGSSLAVNLGTLAQNAGVLTLSLEALNAALGQADVLSGNWVLGGASGFTNTGFATFANVGAGQVAGGDTITLASGTAGTFTETITLEPTGSDADYSGALGAITLTVTGTVTPSSSGPTYILTPAPTTIVATVGNDTFVATNGALNSRDNITAGPGGGNQLVLSGPGVFDLGAPATLANIQTVVATEGQAAGGGQPDTTQTVFLRNGLTVTLDVGSGTVNAANPNPESITIFGANDSSVINLGGGSDRVVLGSAKEVVNAHSGGTALVQATTTSFAAALVRGTASGSTTLEITNAGTATLNAATTYATVQIDQASVVTLSKAAFVTAIGEVSGNSITALFKNQTLGGVAGSDTLTGYSGFGDTFRGASAGLNGDTIKLFGGSGNLADVIDVTDLAYATAVKSYATGSGQGVLGLSDGSGHSLSITMVGSYTLASFALSNDQHGGTFVKFV